MLRHIVRKELRETLRDGRFRWGGALVVGLLLLSLAAGWLQREEVSRAHSQAEELSWNQWLEQGEVNPHSAAHYGIYVFRPVSPLSLVDPGVDPYVGTSTWLEAHYQNPFEHRPVQDTPALARFADLTAATTLQLLVPLLILLMAFQSFAGERERGTLRQALSLGVTPGRLSRGKVLGVLGALALLLVPAALAGALALWLGGPGPGAVDDEAARFVLLVLLYLAYFALFALVAVAVSAFAPSSRTALTLLVCFWIVNGLVAPRLAADLARAEVALPTSLEFQEEIRTDLEEGFGSHPGQETRRAMLEDSVLAAHGVEDLEDLPFNFQGLSFQAGEDFGNLVFDRRFGDLAERIRKQVEVHHRVGLLAPHLSVRSLSMALTGTDPQHHERFAEAAEEHRRLIQRIMNEDIMENSDYGENYTADSTLWAQVPPFAYQGPGVRDALAGQGMAVVGLLIWLALGLIGVRRGAASLASGG